MNVNFTSAISIDTLHFHHLWLIFFPSSIRNRGWETAKTADAEIILVFLISQFNFANCLINTISWLDTVPVPPPPPPQKNLLQHLISQSLLSDFKGYFFGCLTALPCLVYLLLFCMQDRARSLFSHCVHIVLMDLLCLFCLITGNSSKHRSLSVYANKAESSTWELIFSTFKCILNVMFVFRA